MSENDTDIEDLPLADLGTDLEDLDMGTDLSDAELPDLEASDDLLDPFVGDSLESDDPLHGTTEQTLDDLPPDPGMLDDGPLMDDFEPDHLEGDESAPPEVMAEQVPDDEPLAALDDAPAETDAEEDEDDLEPITLSEEELDNILGTGEDVLVDIADPDPEADGAPEAEDELIGDVNPVPGDAPADEDFDLDLEAGAAPGDELDLGAGLDDISDETLTPLEEETVVAEAGEEPVIMDDLPDEISDDIGDAPADQEDEEPVALSEAELDNILGDVDMSEPMDLGAEPGAEEDFSDVPDDMVDAPMDEAEEDEEDITLSDDELSNVLLDTEELAETPAPAEAADDMFAGDDSDVLDDFPGGDDLLGSEPMGLDEEPGAELDEPTPSILDEGDDDDEPVTLSMEELGNIVSDVDTEEAEDAVGLPLESDIGLDDESADALAGEPSILDEDEDEGPVALSEDELSNILEDVDEEQAEDIAAPMAESLDEKNIIVLDEYEELGDKEAEAAEAPPAEPAAPDREELVASTAAEQAVDPGEVKKMISYLDGLFDQLPEDTIREFSKSEYFDLYKKIMGDLGLLK